MLLALARNEFTVERVIVNGSLRAIDPVQTICIECCATSANCRNVLVDGSVDDQWPVLKVSRP